MASEPVEVEVLDKDGYPVRRRSTALSAPINALMFLFALLAAFGILLMALGQVLIQKVQHDDEG